MKDTFKHKGLRNKLASEVKGKGVLDLRVLNAIESVPRHLFMDSSFVDHAYQDKAFPIGAGQTISQPYIVAKMTELLIAHTSGRGHIFKNILRIVSILLIPKLKRSLALENLINFDKTIEKFKMN